LVIERRAELRIDASIEADVGPHAVARFNIRPPLPKRWPIERHPASDDCHEPTAGLQP